MSKFDVIHEHRSKSIIEAVITGLFNSLPPRIIFSLITAESNSDSQVLGYIKHLNVCALKLFLNNDSQHPRLFPVLQKCILLESLSLAGNCMTDDNVAALVKLPVLSNLVQLDLSYNEITADGAFEIANSPILSNLTNLRLSDNRIGVHGITAIASSSVLSKLTQLDLTANRIGSDGAIAIAASSTLSSLTELNIGDNQIRADGAKAIALSL